MDITKEKEDLSRLSPFFSFSIVAILLSSFAYGWPQTLPNADVLKILNEKLKPQPDEFLQRSIKRIGNKTLQLEAYIALAADAKYALPILSNYSDYASWALKGINERPTGGSYLFQVHELAVDPAIPNRLVTAFSFDVPLFRKRRTQSLDLQSREENGVFTIALDTQVESENEISTAEAYMKVFPAPERPGYSWIYINGTIHIKPWLLYEAFPEKVLNREAGDRLQIVLDNYAKEEARLRAQANAVKSNPVPTERREVSAERPAARPRSKRK